LSLRFKAGNLSLTCSIGNCFANLHHSLFPELLSNYIMS
jgi:hypothetical protein